MATKTAKKEEKSVNLIESFAEFKEMKNIDRDFDLFFGAAGADEGFWPQMKELLEGFQKGGAKNVVAYSCPGFHEWGVWRCHLREFLKLAFKKAEGGAER